MKGPAMRSQALEKYTTALLIILSDFVLAPGVCQAQVKSLNRAVRTIENLEPAMNNLTAASVGPDRPDMPDALLRFGQYALLQSALANVIEEAVGLLVTHLDVEFSKVLELLPDKKFVSSNWM